MSSRSYTHIHTRTHTHSVNLTCQEGNSVIRLSRSLDMNLKTAGSVQSNQVIKLIIWEELYSKTYYLPGVKWLSGPQRPDGLVWLGRREKDEVVGGKRGWMRGCNKEEESSRWWRRRGDERAEMGEHICWRKKERTSSPCFVTSDEKRNMKEKRERWRETEDAGRQEKVIHRRGQSLLCLFATAVKPIFWLGLQDTLYFIKLQSAALCLCWGSSDTLLL